MVLKECGVPLWDHYDLAILDLDGVVYIGRSAVPGAPEYLDRAADAGMSLAYVTNNASRPPSVVAKHLRELAIPADDADVVSSAQAAARLVAASVPSGSAVFVIGGRGLFEALEERGLTPVQSIGEEVRAVVSGFHPDLLWKTVIDGAILVRRGLPWFASNTDMSVPTAHGLGPGNGVLVRAVADFAEREPVVAGKPMAPLFEETRRRVGGDRPLVVGDRLDTDIEGARNAGLDSLLVMTGVTGLVELAAAEQHLRPTYIGADLGSLGDAQPMPSRGAEGEQRLGGWRAVVDEGRLDLSGEGSADDWWRVVAAAAWEYRDTAGKPVAVEHLTPPGSVVPDPTRAGTGTEGNTQ